MCATVLKMRAGAISLQFYCGCDTMIAKLGEDVERLRKTALWRIDMNQPTGNCPICEQPFSPGEDIVTCPSCGAPYHRACYQKEGQCRFADKHSEGFEYRPAGQQPPPAQQESREPKRAPQGILCQNCKTINDSGNIFCEKCGIPLRSQQGQPAASAFPFGGAGAFPGYGAAAGTVAEIDGIATRDWQEYIGPSANTYIARFIRQQQTNSKISFMISPFLVTPLYFVYRKMWGWAALALLMQLLLLAPSFLFVMAMNEDPLVAGWSMTMLENLVIVASYISLPYGIAASLFAAYLYRRQAGKHIRALRQQYADDAQYHTALGKKGGVSYLGIAAMFGIIFAITAVLYQLLGDVLYTYVLQMMTA